MQHDYLTLSGRVARETITTDGTVTAVLDFIYDSQGRPFALNYSADGGMSFNTYYYVLNLQGDVVMLVEVLADANGIWSYLEVANYTYDAWGNIISSSGTMADRNPLRYRGYYYDRETGFYYLQSRYYDPANHRFINADAYTSTGQGFIGHNMFAYCGNNPVNRMDPSGHFFEELWEYFKEAVQQASGVFAVAGGISQLDSPLPGPADVIAAIIAGGTILGCGFIALGEAVFSPAPSSIDLEAGGESSTADGTPLSDIAAQFGLFECEEAARAMAKQNNNKGYLIKLEFKNAVNGYVVAPESKYGYDTAISQNGCHWGYCDQNHIVYCNVFPSGLPENEWIHAFTDAWGSEPIVIRIPLP